MKNTQREGAKARRTAKRMKFMETEFFNHSLRLRVFALSF